MYLATPAVKGLPPFQLMSAWLPHLEMWPPHTTFCHHIYRAVFCFTLILYITQE